MKVPQPALGRLPQVVHRSAAHPAEPTEAPSGPVEQLTLSAPGEKRTWFWKSLEAATVSAGQAVGGATGLVLTDQHRQAVVDLVEELGQEGVEFFTRRSGLAKVLGKERRASAGEIFEKLTSDDPEQLYTRCHQNGEAYKIDSLRDLQKLDVAYFGASPVGADLSAGQRTLYGLAQDGFTFSRLQSPISVGDVVMKHNFFEYSKEGQRSYRSLEEMPLVHYFHGRGGAEELEYPAVAQRLKELEAQEALLGNDPVNVYARHHFLGQNQVVATFDEMTVESLEDGLARAGENLEVLEQQVLTRVPREQQGKLFELIRVPVEGHDTASQFQMAGKLAGPSKDYEQARSALAKLKSAKFKGSELTEAVDLAAAMMPRTTRAAEQAILLKTLPENNAIRGLEEKAQIELLGKLEGVFRPSRDTEVLFNTMGERARPHQLNDYATMLNHVGMAMTYPREGFFSSVDFNHVHDAIHATGADPAGATGAIQDATARNLAKGKPAQILPEALFRLGGGTSQSWDQTVARLETLFSLRGLPERDWAETVFEWVAKNPRADLLERTGELLAVTAENTLHDKDTVDKYQMQRLLEATLEKVSQNPELSAAELAGIVTGRESTQVVLGEDYLKVGAFEVAIES